MQIDPKYRIIAGMIGGAGVAMLGLQLGLRLQAGAGLGQALWSMARFFTILTNLLMTASFLTIAVTGRRLAYGWMGMLTISMIMVGLVYHLMLAHLFSFSGLRWLTDQAFHTIFPAMMLWFWLMEVTRHEPRTARPFLWLSWPAIYAVYALLRGFAEGRAAYPFMDAAQIGWIAVAGNLALMVLVFTVLAFGLHLTGRAMPLRRDQA